jgi:hypothetical protein
LFSCQQEKSKIPLTREVNSGVITISDTITRVEKDSYQYFDSVKVIPLETNDMSILSQIKSVVLSNNQIWVHDRKLKKLVSFDMGGKFLSSISISSLRPDNLSDIQYVSKYGSDKLLIIDNLNRKIGIYNSEGLFLSWINITDFPIAIAGIDSNICLLRTTKTKGEQYLFKVIDKMGKNFPEFDLNNTNNIIRRPNNTPVKYFSFYELDGSLFFFTAEDNRIYKITNRKQIQVNSIVFENRGSAGKTPAASKIINFIETHAFIFLDVVIEGHLFNYIYDKNAKTIKLLKSISNSSIHLFGLQNPFLFGYPVWPSIKLDDNWLCQVLDVSSFKKYLSIKTPEVKDVNNFTMHQIVRNIEKMGAISNPILILLHTRNHENSK